MATINVRRDVKDSFYRYKMPKLEAKIEGKGNGIKTVIPNMPNIARALTRPPIYPTKYFGIELGAQVSYEEKNNRYIVNGAHDAAKLQDLLDGFIDKFVLCGACKNPETKLIVTKRDIQRKCGACGKRTPVNPAHRLTTYIIKNPPSKDDSSSGQHASADTPGMSSNGDGDDEQDVLTQQITNMAAQLELNGKGE
ncbi:eukaryotic translation initiation factor 5, partial [Spiromyces aspiralis]